MPLIGDFYPAFRAWRELAAETAICPGSGRKWSHFRSLLARAAVVRGVGCRRDFVSRPLPCQGRPIARRCRPVAVPSEMRFVPASATDADADDQQACGRCSLDAEETVVSAEPCDLPSPGRVLWQHRDALAGRLTDIRSLDDILAAVLMGRKDFLRQQWVQFPALVLGFQPDLIIELGRGYGNSTCAFAIAADLLGAKACSILSVCLSDSWQKVTLPGIMAEYRRPELFDRVDAVVADIKAFDFSKHLRGRKRVFVFWDAHGWDVAEAILLNLIFHLQSIPHFVVVHDMADATYLPQRCLLGEAQAWLDCGSAVPRFRFGSMYSQYEEGILLDDFSTLNEIPLQSAESSLFRDLNPVQVDALRATFGEYFSRYGFWYGFSAYQTSKRLKFRTSRTGYARIADTGRADVIDTPSGTATTVLEKLSRLVIEGHWPGAQQLSEAPLCLRTSSAAWGYSALLPVAQGEIPGVDRQTCWIAVRARVKQGRVGIGLLGHGDELIDEWLLEADEAPATRYFLVPPCGVRAVLIRSGGSASSVVEVVDAALLVERASAPGARPASAMSRVLQALKRFTGRKLVEASSVATER